MSIRPASTLPLPPKSIYLLERTGYDTAAEITRANASDLAEDLCTGHETALSIIRRTTTISPTIHSLASLLAAPTVVTGCIPLDRLLGGKAHMLNIIGPPGAGRERVAISAIECQLGKDLEAHILVLDCQGHLSSSVLCKFFPRTEDQTRIHIVHTATVSHLELFVTQLPKFLSSSPYIKFVVLASVIGPPALRPQSRALLTRTLTHLQAQRLVGVLITSQVQTHFPDGGTFDTSRRPAILRPQLRDWLPGGSHEIMLVPDGRSSGYAVLRTAPSWSTCKASTKMPYSVNKEGCIVDAHIS